MSTDHEALAGRVLRATRRRLLCGVLGATAATALSACAPPDRDPASAPTSIDPDAPVAKLADVPVGGGVVSGDLVVVQPEAGTVKAFGRACPHQQSLVDAPVEGVITCPSHKSKFSAADGSLLDGPATTGLTEVAVTLRQDEIFRG